MARAAAWNWAFFVNPANPVEGFLIGARNQNVRFLPEQAFDNGNNLFRLFPGRKNHFGKSLAQRPVMIDARKAQILKGQMFQPFESLLRGNGSLTYFFQKLQYLLWSS